MAQSKYGGIFVFEWIQEDNPDNMCSSDPSYTKGTQWTLNSYFINGKDEKMCSLIENTKCGPFGTNPDPSKWSSYVKPYSIHSNVKEFYGSCAGDDNPCSQANVFDTKLILNTTLGGGWPQGVGCGDQGGISSSSDLSKDNYKAKLEWSYWKIARIAIAEQDSSTNLIKNVKINQNLYKPVYFSEQSNVYKSFLGKSGQGRPIKK